MRGSIERAGDLGGLAKRLSAGITLAAVCLWVQAPPAHAVTESSQPVPYAADALSDLGVSAGDVALLEDAFAAIKNRNPARADALRSRMTNPVARKLIDWRLFIDRRSDQPFERIAEFVTENPEWPRRKTILLEAEEAIPDTIPAAELIAWYGDREPVSGKGFIRLGEALLAVGRVDEGRTLIHRAWTETDLSSDLRRRVLNAHAAHLDAEAHAARADWLIWGGKTSEARGLLNRLDADLRKVAEARIALRAGARDAKAKLKAVPDRYRSHSGLLYEHVRWLRRRGQDEATWPIIASAPRTGAELVQPARWWRERHLQTRKALKAKDYRAAYAMASGHGLERGAAFADGEWLSGWISLQFLGQPDIALGHFETLEERVSTPISKGRAFYWIGRAAEALGDPGKARRAYRAAADRPTTFYGQLAAEKLGTPAFLVLPTDTPVPPLKRDRFRKSEMAQAMRLLTAIEADADMRRFVYGIDDNLESTAEFVLYADLLEELGYPHLSVRVGKYGVGKHLPVIERAYPVPELEGLVVPGKLPEPALVLGLSRQESEFNPRAVSHAGARGLMQLMPATARITARRHGFKYAKSWLLDRPSYNAELGRAHLRDLLEDLDGSYIMTIAAYNAGKRRVDDWVRDYGDPRTNEIDPIVWIELIPFSETRNYVQRVMENTLVYRNRISGKLIPITLSADLRRSSRDEAPDYERLAESAPKAPDQVAAPVPSTADASSGSTASYPLATLPPDLFPRPKPLPRETRRAPVSESDLAFARNLPFVDSEPGHFQRPPPSSREALRRERRGGGSNREPQPEAPAAEAETPTPGGRVNGPLAVGDMRSLFAPVGELLGHLGDDGSSAPTTAQVAEFDPSVKPSLVISLDPPELQKPTRDAEAMAERDTAPAIPPAPPEAARDTEPTGTAVPLFAVPEAGTEAPDFAIEGEGDASVIDDPGKPQGEVVGEDGTHLKVWRIPENCERFVVSLEGSGRCASDLEAELASGANADEPI